MLINRVCEAFPGVLPSQAVRELDDDPEQTVLTILELRAYAAAKRAYDGAANKVDDLRAWEGSAVMTLVETHSYELRQERLQPTNVP